MKKRVAIYARVSTDGQTVENQTRELEAVAKRNGWKIVETFTRLRCAIQGHRPAGL